MNRIFDLIASIDAEIDSIDLYLNEIDSVRRFSFGVWHNRQHVFIALNSSGMSGYGENVISVNNPDVSLAEWILWSGELKNRRISEIADLLLKKRGIWKSAFIEMSEMALLDLAGKLAGQSVVSMLSDTPFPEIDGCQCILTDDLGEVRRISEGIASKGNDTVIKVKLYGDSDLDREIVRIVRDVCPKAFITGDLNCGYGDVRGVPVDMNKVSELMLELERLGLQSCEDPAFMSHDEWVELQRRVRPMSIIPDYVLRPAYESIHMDLADIGDIYNLHPGCTGSFFAGLELAYHVISMKGQLMIGDDSLIGPGCTSWSQVALALGACWVESLEKDGDSDEYVKSILHSNTEFSNGKVKLVDDAPGFGIELDRRLLEKISRSHVRL